MRKVSLKALLLRIYWKIGIVLGFWLRLPLLYCYSPARLARIAREHHLGIVRKRAWILSGAFIMGKDVYFGWNISVVLRHWGDVAAKLGDRVSLSPGVVFVASSGPNFSHLTHIKGFTDKYVKYAPITIKDDAWIGAGAILLPGVIVGKCSVVGAGAVVVKDVPDYAIVAGVPARIIGDVRQEGKL